MNNCMYAEINDGHHNWTDMMLARFDDVVFCQSCGAVSRVLMPTPSPSGEVVLEARWETTPS